MINPRVHWNTFSFRPIIFSLNCPQSFEATLVMATMSDSSRNHNETRDLDESSCAARNRRPATQTEAVRERLSGSVIGEPAKNSTQRTSQEAMPAPAASPVPFPGDLAAANGDASTLDVTSQPPSKKRRLNAFFQRCFDATFNPNDATAAQRVLAPDSDED